MYNNAKPVFEVSGRSRLAGSHCLSFNCGGFTWSFWYDCACNNVMCPVSQLGVVMSCGWSECVCEDGGFKSV